jgi:hypothetical protein
LVRSGFAGASVLDAKFKNFFFDRANVIKAMDAGTRQALIRAGSYIKTSARSSMRRRKRASAPGQPPSAHVGLLKTLLFFVYDPSKKTVVVGPVGFKKAEAPNLNEFGGTVTRRVRGKSKQAKYPARPYMAPALAKETPKLPARWSNSIRSN